MTFRKKLKQELKVIKKANRYINHQTKKLMETAQCFSISDRLVTKYRKNLDFRRFETIKEIKKLCLWHKCKTHLFQGGFYFLSLRTVVQLYSPCGELYCFAVLFGFKPSAIRFASFGGEYNITFAYAKISLCRKAKYHFVRSTKYH